MPLDETATADVDGLCDWTGETPEAIADYVEAGILNPDASGRFPLLASCLAIVRYWQGVIARQDAEADAELLAIEPYGTA